LADLVVVCSVFFGELLIIWLNLECRTIMGHILIRLWGVWQENKTPEDRHLC